MAIAKSGLLLPYRSDLHHQVGTASYVALPLRFRGLSRASRVPRCLAVRTSSGELHQSKCKRGLFGLNRFLPSAPGSVHPGRLHSASEESAGGPHRRLPTRSRLQNGTESLADPVL